jgi:hypothetical protein
MLAVNESCVLAWKFRLVHRAKNICRFAADQGTGF